MAEFARAVFVRVDKQVRRVIDVADMANILQQHVSRNLSRRGEALEACHTVMSGKAHPPIARRAFVAAAHEARILVGD